MNVTELMTGPAEELVCATQDETLAHMAAKISHHNVGALPIVDASGALCGMISERDIVRALALDGYAALALIASDLMTRKIITCRPTASFEMARKLMLKHRIRHLPVVNDEGALVGMLSQRDLVALFGQAGKAGKAA